MYPLTLSADKYNSLPFDLQGWVRAEIMKGKPAHLILAQAMIKHENRQKENGKKLYAEWREHHPLLPEKREQVDPDESRGLRDTSLQHEQHLMDLAESFL